MKNRIAVHGRLEDKAPAEKKGSMLTKVCSAAVNGIEAYPVEVEVNAGWGETVIVNVVSVAPNTRSDSRTRIGSVPCSTLVRAQYPTQDREGKFRYFGCVRSKDVGVKRSCKPPLKP